MSTRIDDGVRGALLADEDDWFATPETQMAEFEALPWENELEWQLRDPTRPDLGRRQAAIVLAAVVAVLLVLAGILIGRATKHPATKVVTTAAPTSAQQNPAGTGAGNGTAARDNSSTRTNTPNTSSTPSKTTTTPTTPTAVPTGATLRLASTGDAVTTLQTALTSLGYKPGTVDGTYRAATAAAVTAFQTAKGLTADGVAGTKTLEAINTALAASTSASTGTTTPSSDAVPTDATLQLGSKGDGVISLQTALSRLGYAPGTADGTYGATTAQAVKAFQTAKSITADGVAGAATLQAINAALASG